VGPASVCLPWEQLAPGRHFQGCPAAPLRLVPPPQAAKSALESAIKFERGSHS
jgi:hypothetical protein